MYIHDVVQPPLLSSAQSFSLSQMETHATSLFLKWQSSVWKFVEDNLYIRAIEWCDNFPVRKG